MKLDLLGNKTKDESKPEDLSKTTQSCHKLKSYTHSKRKSLCQIPFMYPCVDVHLNRIFSQARSFTALQKQKMMDAIIGPRAPPCEGGPSRLGSY